jgi:threonine dehydratase
MSVALEHSPAPTISKDTFSIIDAYRTDFDDHTRVDELEREFPYYTKRLGCDGVLLADLSDNTSGAFKWRGALLGTLALEEQGATHIVAPSAGNHARGAVMAAKTLGLDVTVAVPSSAPTRKKEGIRELWPSHRVRVEVAGRTFDESLAWALGQHASLLHPYDDPHVVRGQGTVVDDVLNIAPETRHLVVPVGGGGLATGILNRLSELGRSDIVVHLAEAPGNDSTTKSLAARRRQNAERPNPRFGGSAVKQIGNLAYHAFTHHKNVHVVRVPETDVDELSDLYLHGRSDLLREDTPTFEPTSLVAVAALKQLTSLQGQVTVLGTGRNDSVYPAPNDKRRRLWF